jgi:membrane protein DedA with SNARE-associated domain
MYAAAVETAAGLVVQYGLPVLVVAFALEGALVGKVVPTRALFVAAVLAVGTDVLDVAATAVAGATVGQFVLFAVVRYTDLAPAAIPLAGDESGDVGEDGRAAEWFDRWGLSASRSRTPCRWPAAL